MHAYNLLPVEENIKGIFRRALRMPRPLFKQDITAPWMRASKYFTPAVDADHISDDVEGQVLWVACTSPSICSE